MSYFTINFTHTHGLVLKKPSLLLKYFVSCPTSLAWLSD